MTGCLLMFVHLAALIVFFPALLITIPLHIIHDNQRAAIKAAKEKDDRPRRRRKR